MNMDETNFKAPEPRENRSYLMARAPSVDRRCRPCPDKQVCLFQQIEEDASDSDVVVESDDNSSVASSAFDANSADEVRSLPTFRAAESAEGAAIYLRMRPVSNLSTKVYGISDSRNTLIMNQPQDAKTKKSVETHYSFSAIFDHFVQQNEVYQQCVQQKIEDEENFSMLAYGTSGSGKTFTLLGKL